MVSRDLASTPSCSDRCCYQLLIGEYSGGGLEPPYDIFVLLTGIGIGKEYISIYFGKIKYSNVITKKCILLHDFYTFPTL